MSVSTGQLSALLAPLAEAGYVTIAAPAQNSALIARLDQLLGVPAPPAPVP